MNHTLPRFQKYVAERKLAPAEQIPFLAGWASRFIRFSNVRQSTPTDLKIQWFLEDLKKDPKLRHSVIKLKTG